jgi:hypothetical protein
MHPVGRDIPVVPERFYSMMMPMVSVLPERDPPTRGVFDANNRSVFF